MTSANLIQAILYISAAVTVIAAAELAYLWLVVPVARKRSINRRLRTIGDTTSGEEALLRIKAERGILEGDLKLIGGLARLLVQSGLRLKMGRFVLIMAAAAVAGAAALHLVLHLPLWLSVIAGAGAGILIPVQVVKFIRSRRQANFVTQLPDALDVVVRSLRAGHPVPTAMALVGREMADPVGTEFGITVDEMTYGLDMPRALQNLSMRVGVPDLSLLVTAVSLQTVSGGNLSEVLENLSKVLRDRFQLRRKVRSISAEGRFSAYGLTVLPLVIAFAIYVQNPKYYTDVWHEPIFQAVMGGLCVWALIGDFMMYKMINFKF